MYATNELLNTCGIGVGRDSEDSLQVAEPKIPSALDIRFPRHRCASLHCQTEPIIGQTEMESQFASGEVLLYVGGTRQTHNRGDRDKYAKRTQTKDRKSTRLNSSH